MKYFLNDIIQSQMHLKEKQMLTVHLNDSVHVDFKLTLGYSYLQNNCFPIWHMPEVYKITAVSTSQE